MSDDSGQIDPRLRQWLDDRNRFAEQNADGVDLSLIRENLKLTPTERIRRAHRHRLQALRMLDIARRPRQDAV